MRDPYYQEDAVTVYHGDCLDVLAELPDNSVDSVVTDPPYGLEFMGKDWDRFAGKVTDRNFKGFTLSQQRTRNVKCPECGKWAYDHPGRLCECGGVRRAQGNAFQQWCEQWARECLRVLKPGGHLLAFGGTRTWHRLACAVEDAGFEIRDNIAWLYGSGFPKSMDVSKAIDKAYGAPATDDAKRWTGWGTALKPAFEPVVVARKPLAGTVAGNVLAHGVGALNIDGCRVATDDKLGGGSTTRGQQMKDGWRRPWMDDPEATAANAARRRESVAKSEALGRWPSNVVVDECAAAEIDRQSGNRPGMSRGVLNRGATTGRSIGGESPYGTAEPQSVITGYDDEGGASRFFPTFRYQAKAATDERPTANGIAHPTVKPLDLMRWLVRLVTPAGGTVLEPFAGSGTTAEACIHEHMKCIAIEREADYLPIIVARLTKPIEVGFDFA